MKVLKIVMAGALLLPAVAIAAPSDIISQRQENFKAMGKSMKAMMDQFKLPSPDSAIVKAQAAALADHAPKVSQMFPKGTGPESGAKTDALPAIWGKPDEFKAANAKLLLAVKGLQAAAETNDLGRMQAAARAVGGACKSCHDSFRKPRS